MYVERKGLSSWKWTQIFAQVRHSTNLRIGCEHCKSSSNSRHTECPWHLHWTSSL